ncbi:MAG: GGDEF domain-containing protein, partial [Sphingomonadales bacterium]|nr:GGDEF domain-containing protein [Sphingomonadales bacterium]
LSLYSRVPGEGWRVQRFEPADIVENWRTGLRYAVPVDAAASEIAIAVDRPWHVDAIAQFEIMSPAALAASHYRKSMLYAVFIGILTVPILYNLVFFGVTRERFMLWHVGISVGVLGYGVLSSGLVFLFLPDLPLDARWRLNIASIALCVCSMAMFCRSFPEPGAISRFVRNGLVVATLPILLAAGLVVSGAEFARPWADTFFVAAVIPPLIFVAASIGQGLMRDSRVARFQAAAWTPMLIFTTERIVRNLGIYAAPVDLHFAIYYALAFETVISAIAVADRVMAIRRQRDRAQEREKVLAALAETDELTGLPDRRGIMAAFDDEGEARAFAIIDLDHFKKVNDRHGHDTGDRVLRSVGDLLANWSDITAGRLGGEEFVAFLHGADPEAAAERLQRAITIRIARDVPELDETVTASMGVVRIKPGQDFVSAYRASDKCLYRAKEAGRNRVVFGPDLRVQPRLRRAAA